jgi:hypothetical protein
VALNGHRPLALLGLSPSERVQWRAPVRFQEARIRDEFVAAFAQKHYPMDGLTSSAYQDDLDFFLCSRNNG